MKVLLWKGRCRILTDPGSLKEKRSVVQAVLACARNKCGLSAAEVGDHDLLNVAEFGFSSVGTDSAVLERVVEKTRERLERDYPVEFFEEAVSVESF